MSYQARFVFLPLFLLTIFMAPSLVLADSCEDICAAAKEGGTIESSDGNGGTMSCCCLSPDEVAPYTSHPIVDCSQE